MRVDEKGAGSEGVEEAVEAIRQQWRDRLERRRRRKLKLIFSLKHFECKNELVLNFGMEKLNVELHSCDLLRNFSRFRQFGLLFINFFSMKKHAYIDSN